MNIKLINFKIKNYILIIFINIKVKLKLISNIFKLNNKISILL